MSYEGSLNREGRHCHECRPQYRAKTEVARVGAYTGGQRVPPNTNGCPHHKEQKVRPSRLGAHTGDRMPPRMNGRQHGRQNVPPRAGWHPHGRQNVPPRAGGRPPTLERFPSIGTSYHNWGALPCPCMHALSQLGRLAATGTPYHHRASLPTFGRLTTTGRPTLPGRPTNWCAGASYHN